MCAGTAVFTVVVSGIYFDDRDSWQELVGPALTALKALDGKR
jgi:hypothetical protein